MFNHPYSLSWDFDCFFTIGLIKFRIFLLMDSRYPHIVHFSGNNFTRNRVMKSRES